MSNIHDLLRGRPPADVLREYLAEDSSRTNGDAAAWFLDHFPRTGHDAVALIWNLRTPTRTHGAEDALINEGLLKCLIEAGYEGDAERRERIQEMLLEEGEKLDEVVEVFRSEFSAYPLHYCTAGGVRYRFKFFVFLETNEQCEALLRSGVAQKMEEFSRRVLSARMSVGFDATEFELDSYENVIRDYEGNYFLRMR